MNTFTQFGSAIGISAVTAVYGLASTGSDDPESTLSAFRAALIVPVVMVTLGALLSSFGLRGRGQGRRRGQGRVKPVAEVSAGGRGPADTAANPAQQTAS